MGWFLLLSLLAIRVLDQNVVSDGNIVDGERRVFDCVDMYHVLTFSMVGMAHHVLDVS